MSRRDSKHHSSLGLPKIAHPSKGAALAFAVKRGLRPRRGGILVAYRCDECPHWHLGNDTGGGYDRNPLHDADWEMAIVELGKRAAGCLLAENSTGGRPVRHIRNRALGALRRGQKLRVQS